MRDAIKFGKSAENGISIRHIRHKSPGACVQTEARNLGNGRSAEAHGFAFRCLTSMNSRDDDRRFVREGLTCRAPRIGS